MRVTLPVAGPTKQDRAIMVNAQRSINMYAALRDASADAPLVMYSQPGTIREGVAGIGPIRSELFPWNGLLYFVSGVEFYSVNPLNFVITKIGGINLKTSSSRVVITGGSTKLALVDGTYGYYSDGTTLTQITDVNFPANPTHIKYSDGFFIVNAGGTYNFFVTPNSEDPTVWAALNDGQARASWTPAVAVEVHDRQLYICKSDIIQMYYNSGDPNFPYTAYPGAIQVGVDAPYSVCDSAQGIFFIGTNPQGDRAVCMLKGAQLSVISDPENAYQINQLSQTSDAIGWVRRMANVSFYDLTFPSAGLTLSYCIDTKMWSEMQSYGLSRWRANGYGSLSNVQVIGDYEDGRLYKLDFATYTDDSNSFIRTRRTRVIHQKGLGISIYRIMLDADAGVGLVTGQGSDPQVMMRYSTDGGKTWSSEIWTSLGAIGATTTKPWWGPLGFGYDWVFEFSCSDPVAFSLLNLYADMSVEVA